MPHRHMSEQNLIARVGKAGRLNELHRNHICVYLTSGVFPVASMQLKPQRHRRVPAAMSQFSGVIVVPANYVQHTASLTSEKRNTCT